MFDCLQFVEIYVAIVLIKKEKIYKCINFNFHLNYRMKNKNIIRLGEKEN